MTLSLLCCPGMPACCETPSMWRPVTPPNVSMCICVRVCVLTQERSECGCLALSSCIEGTKPSVNVYVLQLDMSSNTRDLEAHKDYEIMLSKSKEPIKNAANKQLWNENLQQKHDEYVDKECRHIYLLSFFKSLIQESLLPSVLTLTGQNKSQLWPLWCRWV